MLQPTEGEGLVDTFVCHCSDWYVCDKLGWAGSDLFPVSSVLGLKYCAYTSRSHKISSSMFCSNFVVKER